MIVAYDFTGHPYNFWNTIFKINYYKKVKWKQNIQITYFIQMKQEYILISL